jgi:hypothetical protein
MFVSCQGGRVKFSVCVFQALQRFDGRRRIRFGMRAIDTFYGNRQQAVFEGCYPTF